jgi:hypothetical protein
MDRDFWQRVLSVDGSIIPPAVRAALEQAAMDCPSDTLPLATMGDVVVIRKADFTDWFGGLEPTESTKRMVSKMANGVLSKTGYVLGDDRDSGFASLRDILNDLLLAANEGRRADFRAQFAKLGAYLKANAAAGEYDFPELPEKVGGGVRKSASAEAALAAAQFLARATDAAVSKDDSEDAYVDAGCRGDVLQSMALECATDVLARAGADYAEAASIVCKAMGGQSALDAHDRQQQADGSLVYWRQAYLHRREV